MNEQQKMKYVREMDIDVLRRIVGSLRGPEDAAPTPEKPLAGIVQLSGVGQVTTRALRAELARRERAEL